MTTEIISSIYQNGTRLVSQTVIYNQSDDIIQLGMLQNQLGHVVRRLEGLSTKESNDSIITEFNRLQDERAKLIEEIQAQQSYVDGYDIK